MARNTILLGALLTILGTGTFALVGFDAAKLTALLPAFFGVAFLLLGGAAQKKEAWRKHLLHAAAMLALLALLGTAPGLVKTLMLVTGGEVARPVAAVEQGSMAVLCAGYLARSVKSFLDARKQRVGEGA